MDSVFSESEFVQLLIASVFFILLLALSLVIFFNFSQKKLFQEKMKMRDEKSKHQEALLTNTIKIEEKERKRIARELHDVLGSQLGLIAMKIKHVINKPEQEIDLENLLKILNKSINTTRKISHELLPTMIEKFGVRVAVEDLRNTINNGLSAKIELSGLEFLYFEDNKRDLHLFRIIQELINNSFRHGKAEKISISFSEPKQNIIEMTYNDNGIGLVEEEFKKRNGLGMANIDSRLVVLQGEKKINFGVEKGTQMIFRFNRSEE